MVVDADGNDLGRGHPPARRPPGPGLARRGRRRRHGHPAVDDRRPADPGPMTEQVDTHLGTVYVQVIQDRTAEQQTLDAILRCSSSAARSSSSWRVGFGAIYARRALVPIRDSLASQRPALRRQREFAADASHELRTPLTVIRSSRRAPPPAPRRARRAVGDALDDIDAEVGQLTALVDDLLLLARSDSGAITLDRHAGRPRRRRRGRRAASLAKPAADRGVSLGVDPEPAMVRGDGARLRQLIVILVDNAIRHSPRGGSVRVARPRRRPRALARRRRRRSGHRPEDMPRVFERFWRAPGAPLGGTGPRPRDREVDRRPPRRPHRRRQPARGRRAVHRPPARRRAAARARRRDRPDPGSGRT